MRKEKEYKDAKMFFGIATVVLLIGCITMFLLIANVDINTNKNKETPEIKIIYKIDK